MALQLSERFEIVKEIGRGSRGVVYLAADRAKGRDVALKVFAPTFSEFQNEIGILSDLHNPFLVEIYDFGFDPTQQTYFLAEEYFDGEPLARWAGRLGFQRVAEITARLCQVLQFLHQQGVFHGDLKPNNILINDTSDNNIKLVDFGLARKMPAAEDRTFASVATVSGTLPYLAPELFLGAPASGRSDLYSLGATLYELVGGHPPFAGPDALTLIEKHLFEMPMNPVPAGSSIPKEFGQLILKLLQKDPSARFEEANDLIRALNLHFNFTFRLGPEKPVLSPELTHELEKKHVERLYEWAVPYYANRTDAESRRLLAEIHYRQGKWDDAEALLKGLEGFRAALLTLQIAVRKGRFEWVRTEAVRLLPEAASAGQRGLLLTVLGEAYFALGQYAEAEQTFREAEREAETAGDHAAHATLLAHVGTLAVRRGAWEEARQHLEQGVTISREIGDVQNEGLALLGLGILAAAQGNGDAAIPLYQQSEAILETIGYRPGIAKVKCHFADLYLHTGSLENGEEKLRQSEAIALEIGDQCLIAHSRMLAAHLLKMKGNLPEAIEAYREAKRCFQALHCPYEEALVHQSLAACEGDGAKENMPVSVSPAAPPAAEAPTPLLGRVFEINRRISLLQDVDQILEVIIDSAIEFTGAERGSLILQEDGVSTVKVTRGMDLPARGAHPEGFSHSLIEEVCATGEPIITIDAATDQRFSASVSVQDLQLRSVICLPFRLRQAIIGVLYLENRLQRAVFSETNIPLLHAFMDQAAIAISNAWIFDELKKSAANIQQLNEQLRHALSEKEIELGQARDTLAVKQAALELKYRYDEIVGRSPPMMAALKILDRVTESDVPVFLYGESGTGKELIARAIHFNGPRAKMPFVPVNCSAIPETLIEAELFGYARGAFTGAERSHAGVFERAQSGTLFLDEIGDMPLAMQAKLLRVLEDGVFQPLGSPATTTVDVRLLTASNKDLRDLVAQKTFREDLFFRIHQIRIALPPLRERKEDLPLLINHFIEKIATETAGEKKTLSPSALGLFTAYDWPGNIRELENTLRNACLLAEGPQIGPEDLRHKEELFLASASRSAPDDTEHSLDDAVACFEAALVRKTLEQCRGNVSRTARHLGIPRPRLYRLMRRFRITAEAVH